MAGGLLKTLRSEPLHPKHFTKLDSRIASSELLGLQASLVVDWLAQLHAGDVLCRGERGARDGDRDGLHDAHIVIVDAW